MNDMGDRPQVLDHLATLADTTRCRLLLVLERHELTVSELCAVLQLPQSTVSRHLKLLGDHAWVRSRRDGTSRLYSMNTGALGPAERRLWLLIREQMSVSPAAHQDGQRLDGVLARRRTRSQAFFATSAGQWDRLRRELFGRHFDLGALPGLLDESLVVGDLGCGTGQVSACLCPFVRRVIAVDSSQEMLAAARRRLRGVSNVEVRHGDLEALPLEDDELDAATLVLVLHHVAEPARVLEETTRALRPGGRLLIVDMVRHDRREYQERMGHVWLGFPDAAVYRLLEEAGYDRITIQPLLPDPAANGPNLFVARGRRPLRTPAAREREPATIVTAEMDLGNREPRGS